VQRYLIQHKYRVKLVASDGQGKKGEGGGWKTTSDFLLHSRPTKKKNVDFACAMNGLHFRVFIISNEVHLLDGNSGMWDM
jgi:hypothetical protein